MLDLLFVALVVAFFAIAVGAVWLCDRVVRGAAPAAEPVESIEPPDLTRERVA